jgi:tetratricopeptide (TPR) repeat protein
MFIVGEAGSGKSALVGEFVRRASESYDGLVTATGECNAQTGMGDAYLPFREILTALTTADEPRVGAQLTVPHDARRLREFVRVASETLITLGPDLVGIFVPGASLIAKAALAATNAAFKGKLTDRLIGRVGKPGESSAAGQAVDQERIFEQYAGVLRALSKDAPLVLVLDDLQWADSGSLNLLFHLSRKLTASRVLVVGTYRPDDVALGRSTARPAAGAGQAERHPLEQILNEIKRYRGDVVIDLGAAQTSEGRAFVDALVDTEPNRLGEAFRQDLFAHTDGQALFTVETLRNLQERGDLAKDEDGRWVQARALDWGTLPARVEGMIGERIGRLDDDARETLRVASVIGTDFAAQVVARVRQAPERELIRLLSRELNRRHQLIHEQGEVKVGPQFLSLFRFRHALFQQFLYNDLGVGERRVLHGDVAAALEALYAGHTDEVALPLAQHYQEAGDNEHAAVYLIRAGDAALSASANTEAVAHYSQALALGAQSLQAGQLLRVHARRGVAHEARGEYDRAREDYEAALRLAWDAHDEPAEWQALLSLGMLWSGRDYARTGTYYQQAYELAQRMDDARRLAKSLNHLGNWLLNTERTGEALRHHEQALAIFERLDDPRGIADTADFLGMASALSGRMRAAAAYYRRAVELFRQLGDQPGLASSLATLTLCGAGYQTNTMVSVATLAEAQREGEEALSIARQSGWRAAEAYALVTLAICLGPQGEYSRALEDAQRGLAISLEVGHRQWQTFAYYALGMLYFDMLHLAPARRHLERAVALAEEIKSLHWLRCASGYLAWSCVAQGDLARAEAVLETALPPGTPAVTAGQRLSWCARAELALARHAPQTALHITEQLLAASPPEVHGEPILRVAKLRGDTLTALDRLGEAEAELLTAKDLAVRQGARPFQWRTQAALARAYQAQGREDEARQMVVAARAIVSDLAPHIPADLRDEFTMRSTELIPSP